VELASGKKISCDAIASAAPVAPAFELARQAGCVIEHRPDAGGFAIATDPTTGQTSASWIHAAGDATGAKTAHGAMREGERAGRAAAETFGREAR
jgi:pyruvate/2-oxoglutarate dehydrogenase complex dihydrolipoamide dehydrogenase (E3) component